MKKSISALIGKMMCSLGIAILMWSLFLAPSSGLYADSDDPTLPVCNDVAFQCSNAFYACLGAEKKFNCKRGQITPDCNKTTIGDCKDCVCKPVNDNDCLCQLP